MMAQRHRNKEEFVKIRPDLSRPTRLVPADPTGPAYLTAPLSISPVATVPVTG
jgi:hypothetical protein